MMNSFLLLYLSKAGADILYAGVLNSHNINTPFKRSFLIHSSLHRVLVHILSLTSSSPGPYVLINTTEEWGPYQTVEVATIS